MPKHHLTANATVHRLGKSMKTIGVQQWLAQCRKPRWACRCVGICKSSYSENNVETAVLTLTTKDANRNPLGQLVANMHFLKTLPSPAQNLIRFSLHPAGGDKLEFLLTNDQAATYFGLFSNIMNKTPTNPPATKIVTSNDDGTTDGSVTVTMKVVAQFSDNITIYGYDFVPNAGSSLSFMLTSSDAGVLYGNFQALLWTNPPDPRG